MKVGDRAVPVGSHLALTPGRLGGGARERGKGCHTPRCGAKAKPDSLFCGPCGDRLARIRAELGGDELRRPGKGAQEADAAIAGAEGAGG